MSATPTSTRADGSWPARPGTSRPTPAERRRDADRATGTAGRPPGPTRRPTVEGARRVAQKRSIPPGGRSDYDVSSPRPRMPAGRAPNPRRPASTPPQRRPAPPTGSAGLLAGPRGLTLLGLAAVEVLLALGGLLADGGGLHFWYAVGLVTGAVLGAASVQRDQLLAAALAPPLVFAAATLAAFAAGPPSSVTFLGSYLSTVPTLLAAFVAAAIIAAVRRARPRGRRVA